MFHRACIKHAVIDAAADLVYYYYRYQLYGYHDYCVGCWCVKRWCLREKRMKEKIYIYHSLFIRFLSALYRHYTYHKYRINIFYIVTFLKNVYAINTFGVRYNIPNKCGNRFVDHIYVFRYIYIYIT